MGLIYKEVRMFDKVEKQDLRVGLKVHLLIPDEDGNMNTINDQKIWKVTQILVNGETVVIIDEDDERLVMPIGRLRHTKKEAKMSKGTKKPKNAGKAKKVASGSAKQATSVKAPKKKTTPKKVAKTPKKASEKITKEETPQKEKAPEKAKVAVQKVPFEMDTQKYIYFRKPITHDSGKEAYSYAAFPKDEETIYFSFQIYGGEIKEGKDVYGRPLPAVNDKIKTVDDKIESLLKKGYEEC